MREELVKVIQEILSFIIDEYRMALISRHLFITGATYRGIKINNLSIIQYDGATPFEIENGVPPNSGVTAEEIKEWLQALNKNDSGGFGSNYDSSDDNYDYGSGTYDYYSSSYDDEDAYNEYGTEYSIDSHYEDKLSTYLANLINDFGSYLYRNKSQRLVITPVILQYIPVLYNNCTKYFINKINKQIKDIKLNKHYKL